MSAIRHTLQNRFLRERERKPTGTAADRKLTDTGAQADDGLLALLVDKAVIRRNHPALPAKLIDTLAEDIGEECSAAVALHCLNAWQKRVFVDYRIVDSGAAGVDKLPISPEEFERRSRATAKEILRRGTSNM